MFDAVWSKRQSKNGDVVTCWQDRLCQNKQVIRVVHAILLGFFPSDEKVLDKLALFAISALQQVAHILLNLLGFLNGQDVSRQQGKGADVYFIDRPTDRQTDRFDSLAVSVCWIIIVINEDTFLIKYAKPPTGHT